MLKNVSRCLTSVEVPRGVLRENGNKSGNARRVLSFLQPSLKAQDPRVCENVLLRSVPSERGMRFAMKWQRFISMTEC